jgi:hypothetical protein
MSKKLTQEQFLIRAKEIHGDTYDYSLAEYNLSKSKIKVVCSIHGTFTPVAAMHLRGIGCGKCAIDNQSLSLQDFLDRAKEIHSNVFDYSLVEYQRINLKVKIICSVHGIFEQRPLNHLQGQGCMQCRNDSYSYSTADFINKAKLAHNNKYDYSKTDYSSSDECVIITCPIHGDFQQTGGSHLRGQGCKRCFDDGRILPLNEFITQSSMLHDNKYNYDLVKYNNLHDMIIIICPIHGEFKQEANSHIRGSGCIKCISLVSKKETKWLNYMGLPDDKEHRQVHILGKKVDGFDPINNIIYEFYGDYWHGNPKKFAATDVHPKIKKTYGELYQLTLHKNMLFENNGYTVVSIWEDEYDKLIIDGSIHS